VSLTARVLEAGGITTVIIGSAYDIVTTCGVPRFLYNDFPLGNPLGKPFDRNTQRRSVEMALGLAVSATEPGTIISTPFQWADSEDWKENYARIDDSNRAELLRLGDENRKQRAQNHEKGLVR
jgi:hypothetical protein